MANTWAKYYRTLLTDIVGRVAKSHGFPVRAIEAAETRLGYRLPASLRDYYLTIGRHPLNRVHNRLLPPDDLEVHRGRLVFMEENQRVVFWGLQGRSTAADPLVFQTTDLDTGEWFVEARCSRFLSAMLCWQAISGLPHTGYSNPMPVADARRATRGWRTAGRLNGMDTFVCDGGVVCALEDGASVILHIGTRTTRTLRAVASELGVGLHAG